MRLGIVAVWRYLKSDLAPFFLEELPIIMTSSDLDQE